MLPALPFLLFLHHYCPLLAKKRHCALWRQHPVCQQSPKNFLTGEKHTLEWSGEQQILQGLDFAPKKDVEPDREGTYQKGMSSDVLCGVFFIEASVVWSSVHSGSTVQKCTWPAALYQAKYPYGHFTPLRCYLRVKITVTITQVSIFHSCPCPWQNLRYKECDFPFPSKPQTSHWSSKFWCDKAEQWLIADLIWSTKAHCFRNVLFICVSLLILIKSSNCNAQSNKIKLDLTSGSGILHPAIAYKQPWFMIEKLSVPFPP